MVYLTSQGVEVEFSLADKLTGHLVNQAQIILAHPAVIAGELAVKEGVYAQLEVNNSRPHNGLIGLDKEISDKVKDLWEICEEQGIVLVPASEYGAGRAIRNTTIARYEVYDKILGFDETQKITTVSGTHIHNGRHPNLKLRLTQHHLLTALDPLFAFMSTSPIDVNGKNGLNCHRVQLLRYDAGGENSPLDGRLKDYLTSLEDLEQRDIDRFLRWENSFIANGGTQKRFRELFGVDNTGYALIRNRPSFKPFGTFEVRGLDTGPLDVVRAAAAVTKGFQDRVFNENTRVSLARPDEGHVITANKLVLPNHNTLLQFERQGINSGLKQSEVHRYLTQIVEFAEGGLSKEEQKFLLPFQRMLDTKENYATRLMTYLASLGNTGHSVPTEMAAKANLYMAEQLRNSFER